MIPVGPQNGSFPEGPFDTLSELDDGFFGGPVDWQSDLHTPPFFDDSDIEIDYCLYC